jgi:hypothetical protein
LIREEIAMRLKYVGVHQDGVEIPELGIVVAHGEIIEVDDAVGKRLALSDEWQVTSRKKGEED